MDNYYGLNFDTITIEDCIELYKKCNGYVERHIMTIVRGEW